MKIYYVILMFGVAELSNCQNPQNFEHGGHKIPIGGQAYPSHEKHYAQNQYQKNYNTHGLNGAASKPKYPLLLSDSRTLNNDGTINYMYEADNGLQQGETVDPDGTRRGFYSYLGADGKPLTVKYTAGKNGFIAEGDHLPKQPNVPAHTDRDEVAVKYPSGGHSPPTYNNGNRGQHFGVPSYHNNGDQRQYNQPKQQYQPTPSYHGGQDHYHQPRPITPQYSIAGPTKNQGGGHNRAPLASHHSLAGDNYSGNGFGSQGVDFGPVNYGAPSHVPQASYKPTAAIPNSLPRAYGGGAGSGPVHSAVNPYQQIGPAGPYNGQFDLGNGGQFSINFNPGQSQEVPVGGDYGSHASQLRY